ncbi:MAG: hypothetical protein A2Y72_07395 [Chloroflexi bacterium RBG_13_53_26]|nr:MAG: hypothetical protein A2Y72_07395 [Chloroflexi bacterium RBG_13_53_26]
MRTRIRIKSRKKKEQSLELRKSVPILSQVPPLCQARWAVHAYDHMITTLFPIAAHARILEPHDL